MLTRGDCSFDNYFCLFIYGQSNREKANQSKSEVKLIAVCWLFNKSRKLSIDAKVGMITNVLSTYRL